MAARAPRRSLGALFLVLTLLFGGIAYAAFRAEQWLIAGAAAILAGWLATLAAAGLRSR